MVYAYWDEDKWEQIEQRPPKAKEFYIGYKNERMFVMKATRNMTQSKMVVKPKNGVEIERVDYIAEYIKIWNKI
jgi:hypothetical protein